jgi:hypothetical protein
MERFTANYYISGEKSRRWAMDRVRLELGRIELGF